jgi:hypothetical protein
VSRAARCSFAVVLAALLAACGNSGGAKTVTVQPTVAPADTAGAAAITGTAVDGVADLGTLAPVVADGMAMFRKRFAAGRQGTLAQREALLARLAEGFAKTDQTVAAAAAASPLGPTASGLASLQAVTTPMARFLLAAKTAKTPAKVAAVFCDVRGHDRLYRTVAAAEERVNVEAGQLGMANQPFAPDKPTRGAWNVVVGSGCVGALRDQFTALSTAARKKQAAKAAAAADAIRVAMVQLQRGMGPGLAKSNPAAVRGAAAALRDLAALEARYMALVARSWRNHTVSGAARKRYEAEIPNAFRRAADRVRRSGVLKLP